MRFAEPAMLMYLVAALVGIALFSVRAERNYTKALSRFLSKEAASRLIPRAHLRRRFTRRILIFIALCLMGTALAGPQWGTYWKKRTTTGIDMLITLDTSRSMLATDEQPDRLSFAKNKIREFTVRLNHDRVGLLAFSGDAFLYCPLTADYDGFLLMLDTVDVGAVPRGGTSFPRAIQEAARNFSWAVSDHKILVIISDGENTEGDLDEAISEAQKQGIRISCIGVGSTTGHEIRYRDERGDEVIVTGPDGNTVLSRLDEEILKSIAAETGGIYVHASDTRFGLDTVYEHARATILTRDSEELLEEAYKERFQFPLAAACMALLVELILTMVNKND